MISLFFFFSSLSLSKFQSFFSTPNLSLRQANANAAPVLIDKATCAEHVSSACSESSLYQNAPLMFGVTMPPASSSVFPYIEQGRTLSSISPSFAIRTFPLFFIFQEFVKK
jgi:hypothetical protein